MILARPESTLLQIPIVHMLYYYMHNTLIRISAVCFMTWVAILIHSLSFTFSSNFAIYLWNGPYKIQNSYFPFLFLWESLTLEFIYLLCPCSDHNSSNMSFHRHGDFISRHNAFSSNSLYLLRVCILDHSTNLTNFYHILITIPKFRFSLFSIFGWISR